MEGLIKDLAGEFAVELRQRTESVIARLRSTQLTGVAQRSPALANRRVPFAQPSPTTMAALRSRSEHLHRHLWSLGFGSFASYVRVELQRTRQRSDSFVADAAIAAADFTPAAAAGPISGFSRGRVLEAYASYTFHNNQFSFGKQALWWVRQRRATSFQQQCGANHHAPLRSRIPIELPGSAAGWSDSSSVLSGRLSGQQFVHVGSQTLGQPGLRSATSRLSTARNFLQAQTQPGISVSRTVIFAGAGAPFTTKSFCAAYFPPATPPRSNDPGDRRSDVDVQYTVPSSTIC